MSNTFRIGWGDRVRGLLTGRVRSVHASRAPIVFRERGGSTCIDYDAFGLEPNGHWTARCNDAPRPSLTIEEPLDWPGMACPWCWSIVHLDRIHDAQPDRISLWHVLRRGRARNAIIEELRRLEPSDG